MRIAEINLTGYVPAMLDRSHAQDARRRIGNEKSARVYEPESTCPQNRQPKEVNSRAKHGLKAMWTRSRLYARNSPF